MPKTKVVLRSVAGTPLLDAVQQCLTALDWEQWVPRNARVVVKPNLCTAVPDKILAANTDVAVTGALCEALLTRTSRISVGESGHLRQNPWQAFKASGYDEMARRLEVVLA